MNRAQIDRLLKSYNRHTEEERAINKELLTINKKNKLIRRSNFPSEISENIVRVICNEKMGTQLDWLKGGDLTSLGGEKIEIKGFSSDGPSSFGPKEAWDVLYFIDCVKYYENKFKIYEIKLKNTSDKWLSLKVNERETFKDCIKSGKRPRISFDKIQAHLGGDCVMIFDDTF